MSAYLITGGTGSFGSALVRGLLADREASRIAIFSRDEHKQFEMQHELPADSRLRWFLGDVRDAARLKRALAGIEYVFHAAALKHVASSEYNPFEAVRTNIMGTQNVIEAAIDAGVRRAVLVSTDKAVNPTSLYGATKLCAERLFFAAHAYVGAHGPSFGVLRCGNFAGSRGSVIPLWRRLLARGEREVPVTDPNATRYWLSEAAAVAAAHEAMAGAELLYEPEMPAFRVSDLAAAIGAEMRIVGLRQGEKMHEERSGGRSSADARRLTVEELRALLAAL